MSVAEKITVSIHLSEDALPSGAGWLLPNGDVITCSHVIDGNQVVFVGKAGNLSPLLKYEVVQDIRKKTVPIFNISSGDIALLSPTGDTFSDNPNSFPGRCIVGELVQGYGFPAEYPAGLLGEGKMSAPSATKRVAILEPEQSEHRLYQGFSGSPIVSAVSGNVLGIFVLTVSTTRRGFLIPVELIQKSLQESAEIPEIVDEKMQLKNVLSRNIFGDKNPDKIFNLIAKKEGGEFYSDDIFNHVIAKKRNILITADGGSGKTVFTLKVANEAVDSDFPVIWLDSKRIAFDLNSGENENIEDLFERGVISRGWEKMVNNLDKEVLLIADGINEVGKNALFLLHSLSDYCRKKGNIWLLANTRKSTRFDEQILRDFDVFEMAGLSEDEVLRVTGKKNGELNPDIIELLSKPQMLAIAIELENLDSGSNSEMFLRYFENVFEGFTKLKSLDLCSSELLNAVAGASFNVSKKNLGSLTIKRKGFKEELQGHLVEEQSNLAKHFENYLSDQGVIQLDQKLFNFHHPLYYEWFCAFWFVKQDSMEWTTSGFDTISLNDSSEDGLILATELVSSDRRDKFITCMYDWRWQRVMNIITKDVGGLSGNLKDSLIGLNSLRLCARFEHTREKALEFFNILEKSGHQFGAELLNRSKDGETELLNYIAKEFQGRDVGPELKIWTDLFSATGKERVATTIGGDPFTAWAASNLLRIRDITRRMGYVLRIAYLASLSSSRDRKENGVGLRWRIVHLLGRHSNEKQEDIEPLFETVQFLKKVWKDENEHSDVRFGACRALIELAFDKLDTRYGIIDCFSEELEIVRQTWEAESVNPASIKSISGIWSASIPVEDRYDEEHLQKWYKDMLPVIRLAKETGTALGWDTSPIETSIAVYEERLDGS